MDGDGMGWKGDLMVTTGEEYTKGGTFEDNGGGLEQEGTVVEI